MAHSRSVYDELKRQLWEQDSFPTRFIWPHSRESGFVSHAHVYGTSPHVQSNPSAAPAAVLFAVAIPSAPVRRPHRNSLPSMHFPKCPPAFCEQSVVVSIRDGDIELMPQGVPSTHTGGPARNSIPIHEATHTHTYVAGMTTPAVSSRTLLPWQPESSLPLLSVHGHLEGGRHAVRRPL